MKLLILIFFEIILFFILKQVFKKKKLKKFQKFLTLGLILLIPLTFGAIALHDAFQPDKQCLSIHRTESTPPSALKTPENYLHQGDYDYERGDCGKAILDYSKAIQLNSNYAEAYNNRAYTYMRMRAYALALPDLDKALELRPNYIHALMNRGDIHNFYYDINKEKAIKDYDKAIALGATQQGTSVCGHKYIAKHGWRIGMFLEMLKDPQHFGCE